MTVAMLLVVSLYFVGGTYARYADDFSGTATGSIAAWKVKVGEDETLNLTFTPETETTTVVGNKIAPGRKLKADVELDLSGTEVAVDIKASLESATEAITKAFGASADKVKIDISIPEDAGTKNTDGWTTINLKSTETGFDAESKYTLSITLEWTNDDNNNENDTTVGSGSELSYEIPVTLTAQQHLEGDNHTGA